MSATLAYQPVIPPKHKTLGDDLKFILKQKFHLEEGAQRLKKSDIPYLQGLFDAGIKDAIILIDNLNKHGEVDVFLSY